MVNLLPDGYEEMTRSERIAWHAAHERRHARAVRLARVAITAAAIAICCSVTAVVLVMR